MAKGRRKGANKKQLKSAIKAEGAHLSLASTTGISTQVATQPESAKVVQEKPVELLDIQLFESVKAEAEKYKVELEAALKRQAEFSALLDDARRKYRDSGERYARMKQACSNESNKLNLARLEIERVSKEYDAQRVLLERLISSSSFQLGALIVEGISTGWGGMLRLPKRLIDFSSATVKWKRGPGKSPAPRVFEPNVVVEIFSRDRNLTLEHTGVSCATSEAAIVVAEQSHEPSLNTAPGPVVLEVSTPVGRPGDTGVAKRLKKLKVAAIMDDFTFHSYAPECHLLQLSPEAWEGELEEFNPDLLFIESAWRGKADRWKNSVNKIPAQLEGILDWCKSKNIPCVFWNKEDPVHFETFLNLAKKFDAVFTTDIDCVSRYKSSLGHDNVYFLPFAAQPLVNNPIEVYERKDAICFAGAYYVRYPDRTRDLESFVATLPNFRPVEIFDRNYGKDDPNYMFPESFHKYIVGTLPYSEIDRAYKGYKYSINLNSIKNSQTMFARRVYELLASGTSTLSNYSRGVRLMFGDHVFCSDDGDALVDQIEKVDDIRWGLEKHRLLGVRKVFREHTYQDRLAYMVSKVCDGFATAALWPKVTVVAWAGNMEDLHHHLRMYEQQTYFNKKLVVYVSEEGLLGASSDRDDIEFRYFELDRGKTLADIVPNGWLAVFHPGDFYGSSYLEDLIHATRYSEALSLGKSSQFSVHDGVLARDAEVVPYKEVDSIFCRSGIAHADVVEALALGDLEKLVDSGTYGVCGGLAIDPFEYCREGRRASEAELADVVAGECENPGYRLAELYKIAESIEAEKISPNLPEFPLCTLVEMIGQTGAGGKVNLTFNDLGLSVSSDLESGKHHYQYARGLIPVDQLSPVDGKVRLHMASEPGVDIQLTIIFFDEGGDRISHLVLTSNRNHEFEVPQNCTSVRLGLRILGRGSAKISKIWLAHTQLSPARLLLSGKHLVLTNHYPSYQDLYKNAFVHKRVAAYKARGVEVEVMRIREGQAPSYHKFEGIECLTAGEEVLDRVLSSGAYDSVLVHFLTPSMWKVLYRYISKIKIVVWLHGSDIQPAHRRMFNYRDQAAYEKARLISDRKLEFWRDVASTVSENFHMVFVSQYFAEEAMADLGFTIPRDRYSVIHNPIDTTVFRPRQKSADYRFKFLSIRPYSSLTYANDLTVKVIKELESYRDFDKMKFMLVGDGELFEETLAPLAGYKNVEISKGFLSQRRIAALHRSYGIFLCPTRMDTQGVSRDEAASSGLVPVTNTVAAVPEFVDSSMAVLADGEDYKALAKGIIELVENPDIFMQKSRAASERVAAQSSLNVVVEEEISLFQKSYVVSKTN
ncbi:glycosyltransferase [Stenotrophomonas sp.]|uniref:glycosyltransferase family protein n=1 Tax=Stenotrophomonas sp. TaxID=69392 RepID=UPI0028B1679B|nr:glycosyltransferase [Stenotrophomonas sp.]